MQFHKYHGAGNDFLIIDDRAKTFDTKGARIIQTLCHRRFGVGADGILLLRNHKDYDFEMIYMNSDGSTGMMCGNGGRCIVHFAHFILKIIKDPKKIKFLATGDVYKAEILEDKNIKLKMQDVKEVGTRNNHTFLCSGTAPHNILYVNDLKNFPVLETGKKIRNSDPNGVNVNFVEIMTGIFHVRTYERGVEDETLACGTGATSVAIASHHLGKLRGNICHIKYLGGDLTVEFDPPVGGQGGAYTNIWLTGPAVCVFKGEIT